MEAHDTHAQPTPPPPQDPPGPRRLQRSSEDRLIAGVAGGLGRYFKVDPVIFRIGFAVSLFFGGLGALAYIALTLFVPSEGGGRAPVGRSRALAVGAVIVLVAIGAPIAGSAFSLDGPAWGALWILVPIAVGAAAYALIRERGGAITPLRALGAAFLVFAVAMGLLALATFGAFATATGHGLAIALLITAGGALIAGLALKGGARLLIAPALALALGVGVATAADLDWRGGIGERNYRPLSISAIPTDGYKLGIGKLAVDLRSLDWKQGTVLNLDTRLGAGELVVAVPGDVCVDATTHTGAGESRVTGFRSDGFDVQNDQNTGATATPRLRLDASLDAGELRVVNDDAMDILGHHGFHDSLDGAALRSASAKACTARKAPPAKRAGAHGR
jgi:phage shock protein PspC (stress-responsive transcriptional regulator)